METHLRRCLDIGEEWTVIQEQHQRGSLSQLVGDGPLLSDAPGLLDKIGWKAGTVGRRGTWHDKHPCVHISLVSIHCPHSLSTAWATLQSFVKWEHLVLSQQSYEG